MLLQRMFSILLLLLHLNSKLVTSSSNVRYLTMPLFEMLVKDLPQDTTKFVTSTSGGSGRGSGDSYETLTAFFSKLRLLDSWKANPVPLSLNQILEQEIAIAIVDAIDLHDANILISKNLIGYNCTRWCYNVSVPAILDVTGWTEDRLNGKVRPIVRIGNIHNAIVKTIEERFCCNMTKIAMHLKLVNGVNLTAAYINIWEMFVPYIIAAAIQCKANVLEVTRKELADLLRIDWKTLRSYDLNEMDRYVFSAYEDILRRKKLFETKSITTAALGTFNYWRNTTMAQFADIVSQFSPLDLEILYQWQPSQRFAIENIPMSIFESGCSNISFTDPLLALSRTLFGSYNKSPSCEVAVLLSRSLNEIEKKFAVVVSDQNVLEIFRNVSTKTSWFDIYELLQLKLDHGIWMETPTLSQISAFTRNMSIPIAIWNIKKFNTSSTLNAIMRSNYLSFLTKLLTTYGYTSSSIGQAVGITESQLNSLTIQEAHRLIIMSIQTRYSINDLASLLGINGVDTHVLVNLPSFEWDRVVTVAVKHAFEHAANAFSVYLSKGGVKITTVEGWFPAIQIFPSVRYHDEKITPTQLARCINSLKPAPLIYGMSFAAYHHLHNNSIVPLLKSKIKYEVEIMQHLLDSLTFDFDVVKFFSVAKVITLHTGMTTDNLHCLYGWSSTFLNTDLAITFQTANETRLCNDFLGRTMFDIVKIISRNILCCK